MKIIIENQELLNEFTSKDRDEILKEGDKFTISYEIELESNTPLGDDPRASAEQRQRYASEYLDRDYFYSSVYDRDSDEFWYSQRVDGSDGEEIIEWYIKKDDIDVDEENYKYFLYTEISNRDPDLGQQIQKIARGCVTPGSALNQKMHQFLMERCDVAQKVFDSMSDADKEKLVQGELPLEDDGAKEQIIYRGLAAMEQDNLFKNYIISIGGMRMEYASNACDLKEFFLFLGLDDFAEDIEENAKIEIESLAMPHASTIDDLTNLINRSNEKMYAGSWHLKNLANKIETEARDYIDIRTDEEYNEYQRDPEDYLNSMGFEWENDIPVGEKEEPENVLWQFLPNFMNKYNDVIKIEEDGSLNNGLEFSMDEPKYLSGIDEAFEFLEIFYKDYNAQSNLSMGTTTGLHTNIGIADSEEKDGLDYNLIKSVLFTNQKFATAGMGMPSREYSRWSGDLEKYARGDLEKLIWQSGEADFPELSGEMLNVLEKSLSDSVLSTARRYPKGIGFNMNHVRGMSYVEFRYPGGDVKEEDIKKATLYYAHLLKLAAYPEYKRKDYVSKLIGFVNNIASKKQEQIRSYDELKALSKGALFTMTDTGPSGRAASQLHNYLSLRTGEREPYYSNRWSSVRWGIYDGFDRKKKMALVTWLTLKEGKIKTVQEEIPAAHFERFLRRNTYMPVVSSPKKYNDTQKSIAKMINYAKENEFDYDKVSNFYDTSSELERERRNIVKAKARIKSYKQRKSVAIYPDRVVKPDPEDFELAKKFDDMPEHEFDKEQQAHRDNFMKSTNDNKELKENKKSLKILIENKVNENKIYRRGSKDAGPGGPVAIIQKLLMSKGYDLPDHKVDGKYGPETAAAVKKFQKDAKIKEDGIVGPDTLEKMGISPEALEKAATMSRAAVSTGITKQDKERKTCDQGFVYDKNQRKCVPFKLDPNAPPANIPDDLWAEAIRSLGDHGNQIGDLENIAIIDYRRPNSQERMWIVQVATGQVVLHTKVGHGANSGSKYGAPTNFSNTKDSHMTSLGAYVTGGTYASSAGHLGCKDRNVPAKKCDARRKVRGVARRVQGLDSTNSQAASRHIIIHGASYSTDNTGGRSWGCFVTTPETNKKVVALLDKGSFLYAGPVSLQA